jgi:DNA polymerase-1
MAQKRDKTLLLIDSHALIHRAYHAFPPDLRTAKGEVVNAVYGYAKLLLDVIEKFKPSHVVAIFDAPGPTVRHEQYVNYKANRSKPDDDLISQIPRIEEFLHKLSVPILRVPGFEADDIIGTIDKRHSGSWAQTIIMTGDRDLFQLVDEDTHVYLAGSLFSQSKLYDAAGVKERMGIGPEYIIDYKALCGDASDNIPGVAGIGDKGAIGLINKFGHIEDIYKHISEIEPRYQSKLSENAEMAELSKQLATIICDVPLSFDFAEAEFGNFNPSEVKQLFQELEFRSLQSKIDKLATEFVKADELVSQPSLFADSELANLEVVDWKGEKFDAEPLSMIAGISKPSDPLTWDLEAIFVADADRIYRVEKSDFDKFIQTISPSVIATTDVKAILHALKNRKLEHKLEFYDMAIGTYVASAGQSKQDMQGVLAYFQIPEQTTLEANLPGMLAAYRTLQTQVESMEAISKLIEMEQGLVPVIVDMERTGITLDVEKMHDYEQKLANLIDEIVKSIYDDVGHEFNIGSPKQVGQVLFEEKGLSARKKTKTGSYSTDERTLRDLIGVDPVIEKILQYRELTKLQSTYIKPLPTLVNPDTGRVHAQFNQVGAVTGRFSSQYPNMQNIPLGDIGGINMREAFVAAPGTVFVALDYSQQELRLLAELSKEENMQAAFQSGQDIHARTAAEIFDLDIDEVTKEQRKIGKTVNFGVVYGISAFGLADRLKIDQRKAAEFIVKYFERYPNVKRYYDNLISNAKQDGYVETILGRRRSTADLHSSHFALRQATEREVMNYPLQGSAADIIKTAMCEVSKYLDKYPAKLILQVHDELIFEYHTDLDLKALAKDKNFLDFVRNVRQTMLSVIKLTVPLEVEAEIGLDWANMQTLPVHTA